MTIFTNVCYILILYVTFPFATVVHAQDQSDFISIDCGIAPGSEYTDKKTSINYVSDAGFIDSGESHQTLAAYQSDSLDIQFNTLTSFPKGIRNCYTLRPRQGKGNRYLLRARFIYGNFDLKDQPPQFDLYLGSDHWQRVEFSTAVEYEIIYIALSDYIHVCLVNIGLGTPFISALELRLLDSDMYSNQLESLMLVQRNNFGTTETLRYGSDKYDRIWYPIDATNITNVQTSAIVSSGSSSTENVPSEVMSTAITGIKPTDFLYYRWNNTNLTEKFFLYMHFAELETLKTNETRLFNITLNNVVAFDKPVSPAYHTTTSYFLSSSSTSSSYKLNFRPTLDSTLPPILNALERFHSKKLLQQQTEDQDAATLWSIKSTYGLKRNWQGDPCLPQASAWEGLNCNYKVTATPRIISLNLSSSGLSGEIDAALANLTMVQSLDLSYNNLTGNVPEFLASLDFLTMLNLTGNNFRRPLPKNLLAKSNKGLLLLSIEANNDQNQDTGSSPTGANKSKKHKDLVIPVVAAIAAFFVLLIIAAIIWTTISRLPQDPNIRNPVIQPTNQHIPFSEVQRITNNFSTVIGKGGFGTVFHGFTGNIQVAVKMLSETSAQGYKEFQAEIRHLMSVHHKNITSLVGYCDEGNQKGIIYEYMANGNLGMHLFDGRTNVLSWKKRLLIAYDAAQGLEYMHHGCKPPIVHRDIKCSNILLNEQFQAKLADFGLSRAFATEGETHVSTAIVGTRGYLDPEYYTTNRLTEKSDVYSYGVVLLELITGRQAISTNMYIVNWVKSMVEEGNIEDIIDPRLQGDFDMNTAWKVVELAMTCVSHTSVERPTMNDVMTDLKSCLKPEKASHGAKPNNLFRHMSLSFESMKGPSGR